MGRKKESQKWVILRILFKTSFEKSIKLSDAIVLKKFNAEGNAIKSKILCLSAPSLSRRQLK